MPDEESYPRDLNPEEQSLLLWLLPADRPGYAKYRPAVASWKVAAMGRRGNGHYILAEPGTIPDTESPLPQILAYGIVETSSGNISVTIRERSINQMDVEFVNLERHEIPMLTGEKRRWTYSYWVPSQSCPICAVRVREVEMKTDLSRRLVLVLCRNDKRVWVYDEATGVNHPIPVTNFYNELMLHKHIRDPRIALDAQRLFSDLQTYSDAELTRAFSTYNRLRTKIVLNDTLQLEQPKRPSLWQRFGSFFSKA